MTERATCEQSPATKRAKTAPCYYDTLPWTDKAADKKIRGDIFNSLPYLDGTMEILQLSGNDDADTLYLTQSTVHTEKTIDLHDTDDEKEEIEGWPDNESIDIEFVSNGCPEPNFKSEELQHLTFMQQFLVGFYIKWYYKRFRDFSEEGAKMDYQEMEIFLCDLKCLQVEGELICNRAKSLNAYYRKQRELLDPIMTKVKNAESEIDLHMFFLETHYQLFIYKKAFNVPNKNSWNEQLRNIELI